MTAGQPIEMMTNPLSKPKGAAAAAAAADGGGGVVASTTFAVSNIMYEQHASVGGNNGCLTVNGGNNGQVLYSVPLEVDAAVDGGTIYATPLEGPDAPSATTITPVARVPNPMYASGDGGGGGGSSDVTLVPNVLYAGGPAPAPTTMPTVALTPNILYSSGCGAGGEVGGEVGGHVRVSTDAGVVYSIPMPPLVAQPTTAAVTAAPASASDADDEIVRGPDQNNTYDAWGVGGTRAKTKAGGGGSGGGMQHLGDSSEL